MKRTLVMNMRLFLALVLAMAMPSAVRACRAEALAKPVSGSFWTRDCQRLSAALGSLPMKA